MKTNKSTKTVNNLNDLPTNPAPQEVKPEVAAEAAAPAAPAEEIKQPEAQIFDNAKTVAVSGDPAALAGEQPVADAAADDAVGAVANSIADAISKLKINEDDLAAKVASKVTESINDKLKPAQTTTWAPDTKKSVYAGIGLMFGLGAGIGLTILFGGSN